MLWKCQGPRKLMRHARHGWVTINYRAGNRNFKVQVATDDDERQEFLQPYRNQLFSTWSTEHCLPCRTIPRISASHSTGFSQGFPHALSPSYPTHSPPPARPVLESRRQREQESVRELPAGTSNPTFLCPLVLPQPAQENSPQSHPLVPPQERKFTSILLSPKSSQVMAPWECVTLPFMSF